MNNKIIQGQHLVDSFLKFFPDKIISDRSAIYSSGNHGKLSPNEISESIKAMVPDIFNRSELVGDKYEKLFRGDISEYNNDHSSADLALIGYLSKHGLNPKEADQIFRASNLYRPKWDERRGQHTYGEMTINKAFGSNHIESSEKINRNQQEKPPAPFTFLSPESYKPIYVSNGMPPRKFVGPQISDGVRLFPEKALSSLVALGAVGKTSILLSIGCHIAAGKEWNGYPLEQKKVAMFFCEETEEEISRKFSANTDGWTDEERHKAEANLITIPLVGVDARLTTIERGQFKSSGISEKLISLLNQFDLKDGLVILDHMQGFTAGDLNLSETATAICREANAIVEATGAAVVMAAHISKANIKATEIEQGFAVGSLAFENATRQMSGMITMPIEDAKKYGLLGTRKEYVKLSLAKNSYGASDNDLWLRKVYAKKYHTVTFEPVTLSLPISVGKLSELQKIGNLIGDYITKHPNTTRNKLDKLSGARGIFKGSKAKVRGALEELIFAEEIFVHTVDEVERNTLGLPKQVKEVLRPRSVMAANKTAVSTTNNFSPATFNPLDDWG